MQMQRVYTTEKIAGNSTTLLDKGIAHRLHSVLRMRAGDRFYLFDSSGMEVLAEITSIDGKHVSVGFVNSITRNTKPKRTLNLYCSLFKKQRFEWMLEKCTEVGVYEFHPVNSEHALIKEFAGKSTVENLRWQKILISAAEQSEHNFVPKLYPVKSLGEALDEVKKDIFVAAERIGNSDAHTFYGDLVNLFIGPEGGWSAEEMGVFKKHNARFVSFGNNILRVETACIVGSAIALL
jgi:16S rRNA (uracil1498-N3)-methyltransferase